MFAYSVLEYHVFPSATAESNNSRSKVRPVILAISTSNQKKLSNWSIKCDWRIKGMSRAENRDIQALRCLFKYKKSRLFTSWFRLGMLRLLLLFMMYKVSLLRYHLQYNPLSILQNALVATVQHYYHRVEKGHNYPWKSMPEK